MIKFYKKYKIPLALLILVSIFMLIEINRKPPFFYQAKISYYLKKGKLKKFASMLKKDKNIETITFNILTGDINATDLSGKFIRLLKVDKKKYHDLMYSLNLYPVGKMKEGLWFYIGARSINKKSFRISYIFFEKTNIFPSCNEIISIQLTGNCSYSLSENWALRYDWSTSPDLYKIGKDLMNQSGQK